jgi:hypothetical protein
MDIDQRHVRLEPFENRQPLLARAGLADNVEVGGLLEKLDRTLPHEPMVVNDDQPDLCRTTLSFGQRDLLGRQLSLLHHRALDHAAQFALRLGLMPA